ncbi:MULTISPECIES: hypothetical protein [Planktothricoides]|uniref:Uncharacterized protein n=2 Tax=Planktothricoides raciborskii TaxID=132608 RepID=A0AAU8JHC7_9CYAN|nr:MULTISPECIES: hypothetical protein [Planktothricoides]MBD2546254.1 hypothetical protein [Planktothricoides raciborskii FACHB-1370]MBD2584529.1 hypothetical protein [Planktothricoides raciborskii FACHB-1261]
MDIKVNGEMRKRNPVSQVSSLWPRNRVSLQDIKVNGGIQRRNPVFISGLMVRYGWQLG